MAKHGDFLDCGERWRRSTNEPTGGRGGIRTHEGLAPLAVFKTAALNHSATLPYFEIIELFCSQHKNKTSFATALLPFRFASLHGVLQGGVHQCRSLGLHPRQNVAVEIKRDPDLAVPKTLARDLGMHASGQHMRGMAVA